MSKSFTRIRTATIHVKNTYNDHERNRTWEFECFVTLDSAHNATKFDFDILECFDMDGDGVTPMMDEKGMLRPNVIERENIEAQALELARNSVCAEDFG